MYVAYFDAFGDNRRVGDEVGRRERCQFFGYEIRIIVFQIQTDPLSGSQSGGRLNVDRELTFGGAP